MTPLEAMPTLPTVRTQPGAPSLATTRSDRVPAVTSEDVMGRKPGPVLRRRDSHDQRTLRQPTQGQTFRHWSLPNDATQSAPPSRKPNRCSR